MGNLDLDKYLKSLDEKIGNFHKEVDNLFQEAFGKGTKPNFPIESVRNVLKGLMVGNPNKENDLKNVISDLNEKLIASKINTLEGIRESIRGYSAVDNTIEGFRDEIIALINNHIRRKIL